MSEQQNRRADDERIAKIMSMMERYSENINTIILNQQEIKQRQKEDVIPPLQNVIKELMGTDSKDGLIKEHAQCQLKLAQLEESQKKASSFFWRTFFAFALPAMIFIVGEVMLHFEVNGIKIEVAKISDMFYKHIKVK